MTIKNGHLRVSEYVTYDDIRDCLSDGRPKTLAEITYEVREKTNIPTTLCVRRALYSLQKKDRATTDEPEPPRTLVEYESLAWFGLTRIVQAILAGMTRGDRAFVRCWKNDAKGVKEYAIEKMPNGHASAGKTRRRRNAPSES